MKRKAKKIHFKTSAETLTAGIPIEADCGLSVNRAEILHTWDDLKVGGKLELPEEFSRLNLCKDCVLLALSSHSEGLTRLYSIKEGETVDNRKTNAAA